MLLNPNDFPIKTIFTIRFNYTDDLDKFKKCLRPELITLRDEDHEVKKKLLKAEDTKILERYQEVVQFGRERKSPVLLLYSPPEKEVFYCFDMFSEYNNFSHDVGKIKRLLRRCCTKYRVIKNYELYPLEVYVAGIRLREKTFWDALWENLSGFLWCLIPTLLSMPFISVKEGIMIYGGIIGCYLLISFMNSWRNNYALDV